MAHIVYTTYYISRRKHVYDEYLTCTTYEIQARPRYAIRAKLINTHANTSTEGHINRCTTHVIHASVVEFFLSVVYGKLKYVK